MEETNVSIANNLEEIHAIALLFTLQIKIIYGKKWCAADLRPSLERKPIWWGISILNLKQGEYWLFRLQFINLSNTEVINKTLNVQDSHPPSELQDIISPDRFSGGVRTIKHSLDLFSCTRFVIAGMLWSGDKEIIRELYCLVIMTVWRKENSWVEILFFLWTNRQQGHTDNGRGL